MIEECIGEFKTVLEAIRQDKSTNLLNDIVDCSKLSSQNSQLLSSTFIGDKMIEYIIVTMKEVGLFDVFSKLSSLSKLSSMEDQACQLMDFKLFLRKKTASQS